jgi:hypothetical protein
VKRTRYRYRLEGTVIEAAGSTTWIIREGEVAGTDVSGLVILGVRPPDSGSADAAHVLLLDERATPQQVQAVRDVFDGGHGGPLTEPFGAGHQPPGFYLVPVEILLDGQRARVLARDMVTIAIGPGEDGTAGAAEVSVSIPEHHLRWHAAPVVGSRSNFRYEHTEQDSKRGRPGT